MEELAKAGYLTRGDPVIVQCFDRDSLQRMRSEHGCSFPLVLCLRKQPKEDDLEWAAENCEGVAPHRASIEDPLTGATTDLLARAREAPQLRLELLPRLGPPQNRALSNSAHTHTSAFLSLVFERYLLEPKSV